MTWYLKVIRNYAEFDGRARRKEFWMFNVVHALICIGLLALAGAYFVGSGAAEGDRNTTAPAILIGLCWIYYLCLLIPCFAVGVRRMHDTGHSGWWVLCPLARWILALREGDAGANKYGDDPKVLPRRRLRALSSPASEEEIAELKRAVDNPGRKP
jgi:uncharacterized membrane protein YhaH (DUF805 family)